MVYILRFGLLDHGPERNAEKPPKRAR